MTMSPPFHLAFPVTDLEATRCFYGSLLGCGLGRESDRWIDFDFFGHQITAHLVDRPAHEAATNPVDGDDIPVRHFGAVLPWEAWHALRDRLRQAGTSFLVEPHIRFAGEPGEQATFFITDPGGNAIEFKSFKDPAKLFARA
ncbi:VOC family protein [Chondromyces apiculatus]|uniref:Putative dioxygenase n=1 Tax=Chondromyces apiculatus DSM 436 TaxID=1192034 RepID=A0A017T6T3_9BACT|nr:VOC family protein [Chondromyces apiculatus]EYF04934.1 putative dioxygenase [Chondromyces apiculatus DSM 436]